MSDRDHKLLLEDILDAGEKIKEYTNNLSYDDFMNSDLTKDAVARNFEVIGEAASKIPEYIKHQYPNVEWKRIIGLRNRIVHEYFGVDYQIVWEIIQHQLDIFLNEIRSIPRE